MPLQPDTSGILVMFPSNINVQLENVKFKGKTLNNLTCFEFFFFFFISVLRHQATSLFHTTLNTT